MVIILIINLNTIFQLQVPLTDRVALCLRILTKLIVEHLQDATQNHKDVLELIKVELG